MKMTTERENWSNRSSDTVTLILRVQYNENDYRERENWSNRSSDSDADTESSIQ